MLRFYAILWWFKWIRRAHQEIAKVKGMALCCRRGTFMRQPGIRRTLTSDGICRGMRSSTDILYFWFLASKTIHKWWLANEQIIGEKRFSNNDIMTSDTANSHVVWSWIHISEFTFLVVTCIWTCGVRNHFGFSWISFSNQWEFECSNF
jgi:hypothetical protein